MLQEQLNNFQHQIPYLFHPIVHFESNIFWRRTPMFSSPQNIWIPHNVRTEVSPNLNKKARKNFAYINGIGRRWFFDEYISCGKFSMPAQCIAIDMQQLTVVPIEVFLKYRFNTLPRADQFI